jgi:hypothetical protein
MQTFVDPKARDLLKLEYISNLMHQRSIDIFLAQDIWPKGAWDKESTGLLFSIMVPLQEVPGGARWSSYPAQPSAQPSRSASLDRCWQAWLSSSCSLEADCSRKHPLHGWGLNYELLPRF